MKTKKFAILAILIGMAVSVSAWSGGITRSPAEGVRPSGAKVSNQASKQGPESLFL